MVEAELQAMREAVRIAERRAVAAEALLGQALHYKTPTLGPSLGTAFGFGPSLGGALVGFSLGPRLHQGLACLGGALVDGNPPRLISFLSLHLKKQQQQNICVRVERGIN